MSPAPAALRDHARRLREVATVLRRVRDVLGSGPDGWTGAAAEAHAAAVDRLARHAAAVADVLADLAARVDGHADRVAALLDHQSSGTQARLRSAEAGLAQDLVHSRLLLTLERDLAGPPASGRARTAGAARDALARIGAARDPVTGRPVEAHLLAYDPGAFGGDGSVVLAAGDPATADDLAVLVPGLGTGGNSALAHAERATRLHLAARAADPADGNAVVAWIGYDAPEGVGVLSERMAEAGGGRLADAVDDLRDDRGGGPGGDRAHLTVVGHSYGATTVSHAATRPGGLDADDVVLAGSPGAGDARSAADLGLRPGHVWVLRNSLDPVAALGAGGPLGLGEDPALDWWGATRLRAESAVRPEPGEGWPMTEHASYFTPGGEGLGNLALVVAARHDRVTLAPPLRDPWWAPPLDPELGRTPGGPAPHRVR